jgi:hypothetical protein
MGVCMHIANEGIYVPCVYFCIHFDILFAQLAINPCGLLHFVRSRSTVLHLRHFRRSPTDSR